MSAGSDLVLPTGAKVFSALNILAPKFRDAVKAAIDECYVRGLNAVVYETYRTNELQQLYYAKGRTAPGKIVTNAPDNMSSWHGYGLAVDVIHQTKRWSMPEAWFRQVAEVFKKHGCDWGGDWKHPDLPHFQWGKCKDSPSELAVSLVANGGLKAVWREVGAM